MTNNTENIERQVIELIATDRISIPVKSMAGKLDRQKPKLGKAIDLSEFDGDFTGERVYARIEEDETLKARGMKEGIEVFEAQYPRHGKILRGYIEEQRDLREINLYFGVNNRCRLTADDYLGVMTNLGFTEKTSQALYPELMKISNNLKRKRQEQRSVLIG